jgi:flagellar assembly protein FliH
MTSMSPDAAGVLRGTAAASAVPAVLRTDLGATTTAPSEEDVRGTARAAGYAAGWAEGKRDATAAAERALFERRAADERAHEEMTAAYDSALAALEAAAAGLERTVAPVAAELADAVVDAALELAEAVIGRELTVATEPGRDALRRALTIAPVGRPVTVRLHPDDHRTLVERRDDDRRQRDRDDRGDRRDGDRPVTLVADPSLMPGDAVAETDATVVDARLSSALARAKEVLGR